MFFEKWEPFVTKEIRDLNHNFIVLLPVGIRNLIISGVCSERLVVYVADGHTCYYFIIIAAKEHDAASKRACRAIVTKYWGEWEKEV